jgi:pyruvate/oxaloacetate carboxyltransferase
MILEETKKVANFINNLHRTPKIVLKECIENVLKASEESYNNTLNDTQEYLEYLFSKHPIQVLKTIVKEQKKEGKNYNNE